MMRLIVRLLGAISALALFSMMAITAVDVVARYFFHSPLVGGHELIQLSLAVMVFGGFGATSLLGRNIEIDLIDFVLDKRITRVLMRIGSLASTVVLCIVVMGIIRHAGSLMESGQHTSMLMIPIAPFAWFVALTILISALAFAVRGLTGKAPAPSQGDAHHD